MVFCRNKVEKRQIKNYLNDWNAGNDGGTWIYGRDLERQRKLAAEDNWINLNDMSKM